MKRMSACVCVLVLLSVLCVGCATFQEAFQTPPSKTDGSGTTGSISDEMSKMTAKDLAEERKTVLSLFLSRDYSVLAERCRRLDRAGWMDAMGPGIRLVYALSLGETGELEKAVNEARKTLKKIDPLPDSLSLRSHLTRWLMDLERRREAMKVYDRMTDDLDEKALLAFSTEQKIKNSEGDASESQARGAADNATGDGENGSKEAESVQALLGKVEELARKGDFDRARFLLIRHRIRSTNKGDIEIIERALRIVDEAEREFGQEEFPYERRKNEILSRAERLISETKYEEALSLLNELVSEGDDDPRIAALVQEATEKVVNRERNRAARLFLAASEAGDPETKKKYLLESRKILNAVLDKYPSSGLNKRVKSHISKINKELEKL